MGGVRLEDLTEGTVVRGLVPGHAVTVVAARRHGSRALTLTYRDAGGRVDERLVYRDDEPALEVVTEGRAWSFDADGELSRLVSEARRIGLAYLFDPMLAVHLSALEPLPRQIEAVYGETLPRHPLRFLLADDPGAGKTIMAGLYAKELLLRGDLARCLVVAPGGLVAQWQDELAEKFGLRFTVLDRQLVESALAGNPFEEHNLLVARLFHGVVRLAPDRLNRDFAKVVDEVVQHRSARLGTDVEVTVEIAARDEEGFPDKLVRDVTENARILKFETFGFEES